MPKSKIQSASIVAEQQKMSSSISADSKIAPEIAAIGSAADEQQQQHCRPISDTEQQQLGDLRQMLAPKLGADVEDAYLLRWLRSKEGRFDEAADVSVVNVHSERSSGSG